MPKKVTPPRELSEQARAWLDPAVQFILDTGLPHLTLRPLAAQLGTSDRMLLYHFGSKEGLVGAVLVRSSELLAATVARALQPPPRRPVDALLKLWALLTSDEMAPYMRLYLELVTAAMRDPDAYAAPVGAITRTWLALTDALLAGTGAKVPRGAATDALATLDGLVLVQAASGQPIDAAPTLRRLAKSWEAR